jgi:hypothetical protein
VKEVVSYSEAFKLRLVEDVAGVNNGWADDKRLKGLAVLYIYFNMYCRWRG